MPSNRTPAAVAAHMSSKPGLAIGFPIWAAIHSAVRPHRLSQSEKDAYLALGLIRDVRPPATPNPSIDEAARGLGFDARLTDLGIKVAALLA